MDRGKGTPLTERERAAKHFGVSPSEVTPEMIEKLPPRGTGLDIDQIALDIRDIFLGAAIGDGAIPLYGRENRKEPCRCCKTDSKLMCTTSGAIGILSQREIKEWCSEIIEVPDGRCERVKKIREAAAECKRLHPSDTKAFFECYAPKFASLTKK